MQAVPRLARCRCGSRGADGAVDLPDARRGSAAGSRTRSRSGRPQSHELRDWSPRIDSLRRSGDLRLRIRREDLLVTGRTHERYDQYHRGVRVFGADIAEQLNGGQVVSTFGTVYDGIDVDTSPAIDAERAREIVEARAGRRDRPRPRARDPAARRAATRSRGACERQPRAMCASISWTHATGRSPSTSAIARRRAPSAAGRACSAMRRKSACRRAAHSS